MTRQAPAHRDCPLDRRRWLCRTTAALASLVAGGYAPQRRAGSQETDPERSAARMITPETDEAINKALLWLAARQQEDGSLGSGSYRGNVAVTALAGMAFMSSGSTPGRGPYGENVRRALDYLLACTQESGFIVEPGSKTYGPMYGHGFATLMIAECYGMSHRPELRDKLSKAVDLIVNTQNHEGGWRYDPVAREADISVTVCQMMALRAARNAGIYVPPATVDRCVEYVKRSQNPDGGFVYRLSLGGESEWPRSAAGVVALYTAGKKELYEGPEVRKGIEYLLQFLPKPELNRRRHRYYFYGHYYAVQAMWMAGGDAWNDWYPAIRDELLGEKVDARLRDGTSAVYWMDQDIGPEYGTAMALIVLQLPNNYLPIFQR